MCKTQYDEARRRIAEAEQSEGRGGGKVTGFMDRYVFPDGEPVAIADLLALAERAGFEIRDVENLREHYALTLRAWSKQVPDGTTVLPLTRRRLYDGAEHPRTTI